MISRYSRPEAVALWSQETKYSIWFEIEAHAATKMAELGVIPREAAEAIAYSGKSFLVTQQTGGTKSATYRVGVVRIAERVAAVLSDTEVGVLEGNARELTRWVEKVAAAKRPTGLTLVNGGRK